MFRIPSDFDGSHSQDVGEPRGVDRHLAQNIYAGKGSRTSVEIHTDNILDTAQRFQQFLME